MVARVRGDDGESELSRLRAEVALLRDELATVRTAEEKFETRLAKMRAARDVAEKSADVISRRSPTGCASTARSRAASTACSPVGRTRPPTRSGSELELIRSSPLFDAAWYLRENHDVVHCRRRARPALPSPPDPPAPRAGPRLRHRPLRRRAPRGARTRASTRWSTSCSPRRARGPTATHLEPEHDRPRDRPAALRRASRSAGARSSVAGSAPTGRTQPAPGRLVEGCSADGFPESEQPAAAARPQRRAALRDGSGPRERRLRRGRVRRGQPAGDPRVDPLVHFVTEGWRHLRAPSLDFDLWWYTCTYLDPTADDVNPLLHYLLLGRHEGCEPVPDPRRPEPHDVVGGPRAAPRLSLRGIRPRRDCRRLRRATTCASWPGTRTSSTSPTGCSSPASSTSSTGIAAGAWSVPHAAYDFGSWSLLARDLVGWERARRLRRGRARQRQLLPCPAARRRVRRDGPRACDWWSLQATSMEFNEDVVGATPRCRSTMRGRRWSARADGPTCSTST